MYSYSFIWNKVKEVIRSTLDSNMGEGNDVVYMEFYNDTELVELTETEATVLVKYNVHYHVLNDNENLTFDLSPFFLALLAFCFSMTIGVLWEFFEYAMDVFFLLDMQKDTVLGQISTVMLDPTGGNQPIMIRDITEVIVVAGGEEITLGLGGYLDVGLWDTMKDLFVNLIGAVVFSLVGYIYVKNRGQGRFAKRFIPEVRAGLERMEDRLEDLKKDIRDEE